MKHTVQELLLAKQVMDICANLKQWKANTLFPGRDTETLRQRQEWMDATPLSEFVAEAMTKLSDIATAIKNTGAIQT